eukprot:1724198-Pyramimonas_sp.AAC.1
MATEEERIQQRQVFECLWGLWGTTMRYPSANSPEYLKGATRSAATEPVTTWRLRRLSQLISKAVARGTGSKTDCSRRVALLFLRRSHGQTFRY